MDAFLLHNEPAVRLAAFACVFVGMALWEVLTPRRALRAPKGVRWLSNLALVALNTLALRLVMPILAVGLAVLAAERGWGLLHQAALPTWLAYGLAIAALDFAIYVQHVLFHAVPALWRLHWMHHTDLDVDVTTGARFHPIEILLSMGLKLGVVAALGPPAGAVVLFEVLLNATAMFNHGNVRMPAALERWLRLLVVTPDMHRVHHSVYPRETNSNFGFTLPWWDRLCGTYRAQPRDGHTAMTLGIEAFREPRELWLHRLLLQPFRAGGSAYPITRPGDPLEGPAQPGAQP